MLPTTLLHGANVSLEWSPSRDPRVDGYKVYYGTASSNYTSAVDAGRNSSATVSGLTPGTVYYFAVAAYDGKAHLSGFSNEVTNSVAALPNLTLSDPNSNAPNATLTTSDPLGIGPGAVATSASLATNANGSLPPPNNPGTDPGAVASAASLATNAFASVAGTYNGLFYQTNADGSPNVTSGTAGFLGNCIVDSNGAYNAEVSFGGATYPLMGTFDSFGNASETILLNNDVQSNLTVSLQLDLTNATSQITGLVSGTAGGEAWTAFLLGDVATNAFPPSASVFLLLYPSEPEFSSFEFGLVGGVVTNSVLTLLGSMGSVVISQTVPISKDGNIPFYVSLDANGGLLEGWLNLTNTSAAANLTCIYPGGTLQTQPFVGTFWSP